MPLLHEASIIGGAVVEVEWVWLDELPGCGLFLVNSQVKQILPCQGASHDILRSESL
jgi:hypothetical protein